MGIRERLGLKEKKMTFVDEPGKQYGWTVATGKQLEQRLEVLDELNALIHAPLEGKTPADKLEDLKDKIQEVDKVVRKSSMAWARAGTDPKYRRAVSGYEGLLTGCIRDCDLILSGLEGRDAIEQGDMARHIERVTNICYFQHAMLLVDVTFTDKDVTPTQDKTLVFPPSPYSPSRESMTREDFFGVTRKKPTKKEE